MYGLHDDSRVKLKISGSNHSFDRIVMAMIYDKLQWLCWAQSSDGHHNRNRPISIANTLIKADVNTEVNSYNSADEFEQARLKIIGRKEK